MRPHVLLNLSNGLRNEFDKFNNIGARMLDFFWRENVNILPSFTERYDERRYVTL